MSVDEVHVMQKTGYVVVAVGGCVMGRLCGPALLCVVWARGAKR